jgi:hypothetical protein
MTVCSERKLNSVLLDALDNIFTTAIAAGRIHDDFAALALFMR